MKRTMPQCSTEPSIISTLKQKQKPKPQKQRHQNEARTPLVRVVMSMASPRTLRVEVRRVLCAVLWGAD